MKHYTRKFISLAVLSLLTLACVGGSKAQSRVAPFAAQPAAGGQRVIEANAAGYATFAAAVDALAVTGGALTVSTPLSVNANKTVPAHVNVILQGAGLLTVAAGQSVTFESAITGDARQHFAGAGTIVLGTQQMVDPKWWGARDDYGAGDTDSTAAVQAALNALTGAGGGTLDVRVRAGYTIAGSLNMDSFVNVTIKGAGGHYNYVKPSFVFTGTPAHLITFRSAQGLNFDGFKVQYTNPAFTGDIFHTGWRTEEVGGGCNCDPGYNRFNDLTLTGTKAAHNARAGIVLTHMIDSTITKNFFYFMGYGIASSDPAGARGTTSAVAKVSENVFKGIVIYPIYLAPGAESWDIYNNNFEDGYLATSPNGTDGPTRAIKGMGSNWAIHVENNWLGDGNNGLPGNDPMMSFKGCYGLTIINNRFANYNKTGQWGIALENAMAVTITGNRFEYMNGVLTTSATGYVYGANITGNDFEGTQAYDLSGMIGPNVVGNVVAGTDVTNSLAPTTINGSAGTDAIPPSPGGIVLGRVSTALTTGLGSGIRTTNAVGAHPDGSLIIQPRTDIGADIVLYNAHVGEALNLGANAVFGTNALPAKPNTFDLGASAQAWRTGYFGTSLVVGNGGAPVRKILAATAALDFTALAAGSCEEFAVPIAGATDGDVVSLGIPAGLAGADAKATFFGFVAADSTVKVRRCNAGTVRTADPAAAIVRVQVTKF